MLKRNYKITIAANLEKIWQVLLAKDSYPLWTAVFSPGSFYQGEIIVGQEIRFVAPSPNGSNDGMISRVAEFIPNQKVSFEHLGMTINGVDDLDSDAVKSFTPAFETYETTAKDGMIELNIFMDISEPYTEYFDRVWPYALENIKALAESDSVQKITVSSVVNANLDAIWSAWTKPEHIINWYAASADWHAPKAENNLQVGSEFKIRMEARDQSVGFDFTGKYEKITDQELIVYKMEDGRLVDISFRELSPGQVMIIEIFDKENIHTPEQQQAGWQAILDNFRIYSENLPK